MKTLLVVEDNPLIALSVVEDLREAEIEANVAHDSAEALRIAEQEPPRYALVDIDLEKPGAGIEVARQLTERHQTICVYMSGQTTGTPGDRGAAVGLLSKPFVTSALVTCVKALEHFRETGEREAGDFWFD